MVMAYFAVMFSVDGPTLPMALAASPLNVPAAVVDSRELGKLIRLEPALMVLPLLAAPFCWSAIALFAADAEHSGRNGAVRAVLLAHYVGIAIWFWLYGSDYLLRPFLSHYASGLQITSKGLRLRNISPLVCYAVGQFLIWWALLRYRIRGIVKRAS